MKTARNVDIVFRDDVGEIRRLLADLPSIGEVEVEVERARRRRQRIYPSVSFTIRFPEATG